MKTFKEFMSECTLEEALITFGGKAYPKFGQILIMAGGAGSGKGFAIDKLVGLEGRVLDVDAVKKLALGTTKLASRIKKETGIDIKDFNLREPTHVSKIHELLSDVYGFTKAVERKIFGAALLAPSDRKPNLIFDVTMKDLSKLESISRNVQELGYEKQNIHLVWVINDVEVAKEQNRTRPRVVPEEILMVTHEGASLTMRKLVGDSGRASKYLDGDIVFAFNKEKVDSEKIKSKFGGHYYINLKYIRVKTKGKPSMSYSDLEKDVLAKIISYVPGTETWDK